MRLQKILLILVAVFFSFNPHGFSGTNVGFDINVEGSLSFTSDKSSLRFDFSDFRSGAISNSEIVTYTIVSNNVVRSENLILVRMDELWDGINLEAEMGPFSKRSGNARLIPSQGGSVTIGTDDVGLADKVIDEGDGLIMDGTATITYRTVLTKDQSAGDHFGIVTVSFFAV